MDKNDIIAELRRITSLLQISSLTIGQFKKHSRISPATVMNKFGSWNEAIEAAGLVPRIPINSETRPDDVYLEEIIRLTIELGKKPTISRLLSQGRFTVKPYRKRWGSWEAACEAAYAKFGFPLETEDIAPVAQPPPISRPLQRPALKFHKPHYPDHRRKVQYGEPIDFRGLRHAPINEQGVVYIFGMVSRELGFLIESVQTGYPDCEGKRAVDAKQQRWERVLIEFEYKSSNFHTHGHDPEGCDLIVCWIHDWEDCPLEVLELSSQLKYLPNQ